MNKKKPWLSEAEEALFSYPNERNVLSAIAFRNEMDFSFGTGINPEAILSRNWEVVILPHDREDECDERKKDILDFLKEKFTSKGVAIPGRSPGYGLTVINPELEDFDPPLVARIDIGYSDYGKIRGSMIAIYNRSFSIFPDCRGFYYLEVDGFYSLLAARGEVLRGICCEDYKKNWNYAIEGWLSETPFILNLRNLMRAYGYA